MQIPCAPHTRVPHPFGCRVDRLLHIGYPVYREGGRFDAEAGPDHLISGDQTGHIFNLPFRDPPEPIQHFVDVVGGSDPSLTELVTDQTQSGHDQLHLPVSSRSDRLTELSLFTESRSRQGHVRP